MSDEVALVTELVNPEPLAPGANGSHQPLDPNPIIYWPTQNSASD